MDSFTGQRRMRAQQSLEGLPVCKLLEDVLYGYTSSLVPAS